MSFTHFFNEQMKNKEHRYTIEDLHKFAYNEGKDYSSLFVEWLDWIIDIFDAQHYIDRNFAQNIAEKTKENELFFQMMMQWLIDNTKAQEKGELLDWFGTQYEEQIKSKAKADALGQFYTPMSLCLMLAKIDADGIEHPEEVTANDCACGSGRLLIAMEQELRNKYGYSNKRYYTASDIDHMSVKMCALNLMIAGVCGQVLCRDALKMETWYGYEINEIRSPFPCSMYSIRKIDPDEIRKLEMKRMYERKKRNLPEPIKVTSDDNGQQMIDFSAYERE